MSSPRFYCPQIANLATVPQARQCLDVAEARHASSVLRLRVGSAIELFDGLGQCAHAKVTECRREYVEFEIGDWVKQSNELRYELTLAIALPKGDRQRIVVDAATELGVTRLVPLLTKRGVAQPTENALERLRRHVIEACKQSGRNRLMDIMEPVSIATLASAHADPANPAITHFASEATVLPLKFVAHPYGVYRQSLYGGCVGAPRNCLLAVGPEGGFEEYEVEALVHGGWRAVELGPTILRIEVAAIAALAQIVGWYHASSSNITS